MAWTTWYKKETYCSILSKPPAMPPDCALHPIGVAVPKFSSGQDLITVLGLLGLLLKLLVCSFASVSLSIPRKLDQGQKEGQDTISATATAPFPASTQPPPCSSTSIASILCLSPTQSMLIYQNWGSFPVQHLPQTLLPCLSQVS